MSSNSNSNNHNAPPDVDLSFLDGLDAVTRIEMEPVLDVFRKRYESGAIDLGMYQSIVDGFRVGCAASPNNGNGGAYDLSVPIDRIAVLLERISTIEERHNGSASSRDDCTNSKIRSGITYVKSMLKNSSADANNLVVRNQLIQIKFKITLDWDSIQSSNDPDSMLMMGVNNIYRRFRVLGQDYAGVMGTLAKMERECDNIERLLSAPAHS